MRVDAVYTSLLRPTSSAMMRMAGSFWYLAGLYTQKVIANCCPQPASLARYSTSCLVVPVSTHRPIPVLSSSPDRPEVKYSWSLPVPDASVRLMAHEVDPGAQKVAPFRPSIVILLLPAMSAALV